MTRPSAPRRRLLSLLQYSTLLLALLTLVGCGTLGRAGSPLTAPNVHLDSVSVDLPSSKSLSRSHSQDILRAKPDMFPGAAASTNAPLPENLDDVALETVGHESTGDDAVLGVVAAVAQGVLSRAVDHRDGVERVNVSVRFSVDSASLAK